jgi:catechol 2,3-dioxygenase-like lactoylglutathione lyase family enzyme
MPPEAMIHRAHVILFVRDQSASRRFYADVLSLEPDLDVPGMTEFRLGDGCRLGLMPAAGVERLLGEAPTGPGGGLRGELYLYVDDPVVYHRRALGAGARELSPLARRDWGDLAAYSVDSDGHVLAFAAAPPRGG